MKMKPLIIVIMVLSISGCSWYGYKDPSNHHFHRVNNYSNAYTLGVQNFTTNETSQKRLNSVKEAFSDVQDIFLNNKKFEKIILSQSWVSSCDGETIEKTSGKELLSDLRALSVKVSVYPKKPWQAIGLTDAINKRMAIDPSRIDLANKDEIIDSSLLINTTAHEVTHLILDENNLIKYRDEGHGKKNCLKNDLASYRVGKAAQAVWIHDKLAK
ncbi:hypothetical protein [Pleionea sediminis]|uniref:hypothetical protein n=1 Tax=Pleionea sediminis TaxID=2569479 RepID=UPI0011860BFB|nr:hypothetical protein [Pleionea sediminis]